MCLSKQQQLIHLDVLNLQMISNVVKQITIVGEAKVSRDFVQVPELVGFRLLLSHLAGDPLNYGLLFINFPDTILFLYWHQADTFPFRTV